MVEMIAEITRAITGPVFLIVVVSLFAMLADKIDYKDDE